MSEIVKRVASALKANLAKQLEAKPLLGDETSADWHATGRTVNLEEMARAAFEEMRNPDHSMTVAGDAHLCSHQACECDEFRIWVAMIDAALK